MPTIQKLTWEQFEHDMMTLIKNIKSDSRSNLIDHLLIITRGGLIPGAFLAQQLGIKNIKTLCLQSYSDDRSQHSTIQHLSIDGFEHEAIQEPHRWLIIDEMADSGKSIQFVKRLYPAVLTACVYVKNPKICDFYATILNDDAWIDFPWETYESIKN